MEAKDAAFALKCLDRRDPAVQAGRPALSLKPREPWGAISAREMHEGRSNLKVYVYDVEVGQSSVH